MIPPLCFVTDADAPLSIPEQAEAAARGGATWIQLRHKTLPDAAFAELARDLTTRLAGLGATLILNDRVDVAVAIGAAGLHIGQSDGDPSAIRRRIGPDMVLGLSIEAADQLAAIPPDTLTYLGVGPVRATGSKADAAPPIGFDGLHAIANAAQEPVMAIGGLTAKDARAVRAAGCAGLAVVSAISRSADPEAASRAILSQWTTQGAHP